MRSPPGLGISTDLWGEHRMQRANTETNATLADQNQTFSMNVCTALMLDDLLLTAVKSVSTACAHRHDI